MTILHSPSRAEAPHSSPLYSPASYLRRRASRSDSKRHRMSSSRTGWMLAAILLGHTSAGKELPGPLTLRMIERVVSSINSTRTCVTPPREPNFFKLVSFARMQRTRRCSRTLEGWRVVHTGTAQDSGHLDQLDGDLGGFHDCD
jgi:hypothetical protein